MEYRFADCALDDVRHALTRSGSPMAVEPLVFDLLLLLARQAGDLVTRDQLVAELWQGRFISDSAVSACIAAARRAVGDDGKRQAVIRTVARRGLQMVAPVTRIQAARPLAAASAPTIRYTKSTTGQALAYALCGEGPPVIRCYPASHLELEWSAPRERALFDLVCARNRLLRIDHIGVGLSDRDLARYDPEAMAEDLARAADAAGIGQFALLSESGGVHVALRFIAQYPERVSRLAILGGYVDGRARRGSAPQTDFLRAMLEEQGEATESSLIRAFSLAYFSDGPIEEANAHARVYQASLDKRVRLMARDAINNISSAALLEQVRCPTLVVHGRSDTVHPLSEARKLATGIPGAELLILESANHLPLPGHATWPLFAEAFRAFLDG